MDRRKFLAKLAFFHGGSLVAFLPFAGIGCRGKQYAHVLSTNDRDVVGSHAAGAETWEPLIQESVAKLLGRQHDEIVQQTGATDDMVGCKRICFVGVENRSAEELGDFHDQIFEKVDQCITSSGQFEVINRRFVEAGLRQCALRPDDLFLPAKQRMFAAALEKQDQSFDYLLFAVVTSGTTRSNKDTQRDYLFTLELIDIHSGHADKESAEIRKGYHKTKLGAIRKYGHT